MPTPAPRLTRPLPPRRRKLLAGAAVAAFGLTGCQEPQAPFRVGAIAFAGYGFLFLAQEQGLLDGANVRLHELRSNTDVLRALALGRLEAAALTLDEVLTGIHFGLPLKVVAVLDVSAGADAVMGRAAFTRPEMARGQRVGVEGSAVGALMLSAFLEAAKLRPEDVRLVPMPLTETAAALREGKVDLVVTAEPWASQLEDIGATRLFDSRSIPGRIVDVLAVRSELLTARDDAIRRVLRGHFAAQARFRQSPESVLDPLGALLRLAPAAVPSAFSGLDLPDQAANARMLAPGGSVAQGLPDLAQLLYRQGLISKAVDPSSLLDTRWVGGGL